MTMDDWVTGDWATSLRRRSSVNLPPLTDTFPDFTEGPLWLGPPSHQVSPGGGWLSEKRRPWESRGPGSDAGSQRLQHPQDCDRRHARLHGADRGLVPCVGRPQEERPRVWEECERIHSGPEATSGGQLCAQGRVNVLLRERFPAGLVKPFKVSNSVLSHQAPNEANGITSHLCSESKWGVSSWAI